MKICLLNASNPGETLRFESDEYVDLRCGPDSEEVFKDGKVLKQFNSWHAWAADLKTEFFVYGKSNWQNCYKYDGIIILVNRDIHLLLPLVKKLKTMKKKVAISFHEGVQDLITSSGAPNEVPHHRWIGLYNLVKESDFYINIFDQFDDFFWGWLGEEKVRSVPHVSLYNKGLSEHLEPYIKPLKDRPYDVLIGTRTLGQRLNRASLVSLCTLNNLAKKGVSVHYLSEDGDVTPLFKQMGLENIVCHVGPLSWVDWLKFLAQYKIVAHFDNSFNMGQICFDAMRVKTYPIGGVTTNNIRIGTSDEGDSELLLSMTDYVLHQVRSGADFESIRTVNDRLNDRQNDFLVTRCVNGVAADRILKAFGG